MGRCHRCGSDILLISQTPQCRSLVSTITVNATVTVLGVYKCYRKPQNLTESESLSPRLPEEHPSDDPPSWGLLRYMQQSLRQLEQGFHVLPAELYSFRAWFVLSSNSLRKEITSLVLSCQIKFSSNKRKPWGKKLWGAGVQGYGEGDWEGWPTQRREM